MMKFWRINLVFVCIVLFSAAIIGRLFYLQVFQSDYYRAMAQGLHMYPREEPIERGEFFLRNGEPLAINKNFPLLFASPSEISDPDNTAKSLSGIIGLPEDVILEKINKANLYSVIKNKLTKEELSLAKDLKLPGIYFNDERLRYFPQETLASKLIGFVDADFQGQYGLEGYYNDLLLDKDKGADLILTIDYNTQFEAEKLLRKAKDDLEIESGQIIVMDPNNGKILAMASFPDFNPNNYQEYAEKKQLEIFNNEATQSLFEPGSVFKPITMAGALEEGRISPQTTYTDEGKVKIGGYTISNYGQRTWGERTMTEVLERSINTGVIFAERQLGHNLFLSYIEKFGLFSPTKVDFLEVWSENKELKNGREINFATAAFGQGIEITPLQLVRAYAAIANGGRLVRPYLVDKVIETNEDAGLFAFNSKIREKIIETKPELSEPVISSKTSTQLAAMLVSVIENGYGKEAKIPGYYIAGKTGTAQVSFSSMGIKKAGYSDKTVQSFIGFFPAFSPKFLIMVKLDNPKANTAEYSAMPIFHALAEYIIHVYQVPPDYQE